MVRTWTQPNLFHFFHLCSSSSTTVFYRICTFFLKLLRFCWIKQSIFICCHRKNSTRVWLKTTIYQSHPHWLFSFVLADLYTKIPYLIAYSHGYRQMKKQKLGNQNEACYKNMDDKTTIWRQLEKKIHMTYVTCLFAPVCVLMHFIYWYSCAAVRYKLIPMWTMALYIQIEFLFILIFDGWWKSRRASEYMRLISVFSPFEEHHDKLCLWFWFVLLVSVLLVWFRFLVFQIRCEMQAEHWTTQLRGDE